jgi:hypothetical protein
MEFFRRHYKTVVWIMIFCFLMYLLPSVYVATR